MKTKTVHKYTLDLTDRQIVALPEGARILSVQTQGQRLRLWALVDADATPEAVEIAIRGTGHPIDDAEVLEFIDTFQMNDGQLVFHVFRVMA